MKVQCDRPVSVDTSGPARSKQAPRSCSRPKAALASKSMGRTTRAISHACQPTPILESEEGVEDTNMSVTSHDDANADQHTDWQTDIATEMSVMPDDDIIVDQPAAIASADDFPAHHWLEDADEVPIPIPPPTPAAN
ncbi:hypothetical protein BDR07DRAFT_1478904 [Suillus spraguei]|nr:hypothetical protein BDR07DRAFT_1478904 [Suillus spraguei]